MNDIFSESELQTKVTRILEHGKVLLKNIPNFSKFQKNTL